MAYTDTKHIELMSNRIECFLVYIFVPVKLIASVLLVSPSMLLSHSRPPWSTLENETRFLL